MQYENIMYEITKQSHLLESQLTEFNFEDSVSWKSTINHRNLTGSRPRRSHCRADAPRWHILHDVTKLASSRNNSTDSRLPSRIASYCPCNPEFHYIVRSRGRKEKMVKSNLHLNVYSINMFLFLKVAIENVIFND